MKVNSETDIDMVLEATEVGKVRWYVRAIGRTITSFRMANDRNIVIPNHTTNSHDQYVFFTFYPWLLLIIKLGFLIRLINSSFN